jgi:hypothetical protein
MHGMRRLVFVFPTPTYTPFDPSSPSEAFSLFIMVIYFPLHYSFNLSLCRVCFFSALPVFFFAGGMRDIGSWKKAFSNFDTMTASCILVWRPARKNQPVHLFLSSFCPLTCLLVYCENIFLLFFVLFVSLSPWASFAAIHRFIHLPLLPMHTV